jgi:hypothetical protein
MGFILKVLKWKKVCNNVMIPSFSNHMRNHFECKDKWGLIYARIRKGLHVASLILDLVTHMVLAKESVTFTSRQSKNVLK